MTRGAVAPRVLILAVLAIIVALPFVFRPRQRPLARADDTVVVITPHNEAIRHEFGVGFSSWYRARTGRSVQVDWRVVGGTSDIARFLESEYVGSFRQLWTGTLGRPWSGAVQAAFANARQAPGTGSVGAEARAAFLAANVSCGIDVFFGGGSYDLVLQAAAGRIVASHVIERHPDWFRDEVIPRTFAGEEYWDAQARWVGNVVSSYGILYNRDSLRRLGIEHPPAQWQDLTDPRYVGEIALADPTKSSSMAKAFENLIQQQIQQRLVALQAADPARRERAPAAIEARAIREGWLAGLRMIQLIGANARYFTDSAQKPPIDVAQGDCAAGICIDFYGRSQAEVTARRADDRDHDRLVFVTPRGGTVSSVDPIALLRGAPHPGVAEAFIEYTLTLDGQKLWNFRPGTPGGPERFALRRLPVRRDFYAHDEWTSRRSDPEANPFAETDRLVYRPAWTAHLFREMGLLVRVMVFDTHQELVRAWRAMDAASPAARQRALAALQALTSASYDRVAAELTPVVNSSNKVDEIRFAKRLAAEFRRDYRRAEQLARE